MTRILLNHFKWDLEKLYEKYYDGDQETLFQQAHIVYPFKGSALADKVIVVMQTFVSISSNASKFQSTASSDLFRYFLPTLQICG